MKKLFFSLLISMLAFGAFQTHANLETSNYAVEYVQYTDLPYQH